MMWPTPPDSSPKPGWKSRRFLTFAALGAVLAPFAVSGSSSLTPPASSALQCATARSVLDASDISYLGAIRMPASGVDTQLCLRRADRPRRQRSPASLRLRQQRRPRQRTRSTKSKTREAATTPNYTQAPRATLVTAWGDIYHGKRTSWDCPGRARSTFSICFPTACTGTRARSCSIGPITTRTT